MEDLLFESSLSMEEIEANFKDVDFFSGLLSGLEEVLAYEKGELALDSAEKTIPDFVAEYDALKPEPAFVRVASGEKKLED